MVEPKVQIVGLKNLESKLSKIKDSDKFLDPVIAKIATATLNTLIKETPFRGDDAVWPKTPGTGRTRNAWKDPVKLADSVYSVENTMSSHDKKHSIIDILNYGRGPIRPKRAKALYIPLTRRAKYKKYGDEPNENWEYGKDYIYRKKMGPYKGTKFMTKILEKAKRIQEKAVLKAVKEYFK